MTLYGPLYAAAAVVGFSWVALRYRGIGYSWPLILRFSAILAWSGIAGAYLFHSLLSFFPQLFPPGLITRHFGPNTITGMIIGGGIASLVFCRYHNLPLGRHFDVGTVPFPLAQAIGRLGCFSAGCCFGKPTTGSVGMLLPGLHGRVAFRYPTQLISAGANLAILGVLLFVEHLRRRRGDDDWPFPGFIYLLWVCLYATKRFLLEFIRGTALPVILGVTWAQALALVALTFAGTAIMVNLRRRTRVNAE